MVFYQPNRLWWGLVELNRTDVNCIIMSQIQIKELFVESEVGNPKRSEQGEMRNTYASELCPLRRCSNCTLSNVLTVEEHTSVASPSFPYLLSTPLQQPQSPISGHRRSIPIHLPDTMPYALAQSLSPWCLILNPHPWRPTFIGPLGQIYLSSHVSCYYLDRYATTSTTHQRYYILSALQRRARSPSQGHVTKMRRFAASWSA